MPIMIVVLESRLPMQRYDNDLYYAEDVAMLARQRWPQDHKR